MRGAVIGPEGRRSAVQVAAEVSLGAVLLLVAWALTYLAGGTRTAAPHLFYVPVLFTALRFGPLGGLVAGIAAALLCGPLMPLDVAAGLAQRAENWLVRGGFFSGIGLLAGAAVAHQQRVLRRELDIIDRERDLATQRAALLQVVSHEIRTPVTILRGSLEMIGAMELSQQQLRQLVPAMARATERLQGLGEVVLAAVNADPVTPPEREVALAEVLDEATASLPSSLDRQRIRRTAELDAATIRTVPNHLRVVLSCLIGNALRFSPDDSPVELGLRTGVDGCEVTIRDRGCGIPEEDVERLFQPFRQGDDATTREYDGMGLGLYAARRIARQLGGDVRLEPADDGGTVAVVELPRGLRPSSRQPLTSGSGQV